MQAKAAVASEVDVEMQEEEAPSIGHMREFVIPRVHVATDRAWAGSADVLSKSELREFAHQARLERQAREGAEALISRAEVEAESIVRRARQQARALGDTQLKLWQEAFDARQAELAEALGVAVTVVVDSVLKSVLASSDDLPVKASIELAMRALSVELRAAAVCHPLDLPVVRAQAGRMGTHQVEQDAALPRGQIVFSGDEGEVRVDGQRVLDRLSTDLRQAFQSKAMPAPP